MSSDYHYRERPVFPGRLQLAALFIGIAFVIGLIAAYCFVYAAWLREPDEGDTSVTIVIVEGDRFSGVASYLWSDAIAHPTLLKLYV